MRYSACLNLKSSVGGVISIVKSYSDLIRWNISQNDFYGDAPNLRWVQKW